MPRSSGAVHSGVMAAQLVMTGDEWAERMRHARPPTSDDVPITSDGRRLDSPEAVREWLAGLAERRLVGGVSAGA